MWDALRLAMNAHDGQVDKLGKPYINHVTAVARGVAGFGEQATIVGLLHDVVEDTSITIQDLRRAGVRVDALASIQLLTKSRGRDLRHYLEAITRNQMALWVKISDNAHNTLPERVAAIEDEATRLRLERKYALGREILWKAAPQEQIRQILRAVNPSLEALLEEP
jgi:(p)ppGpp synthase/HD superfamily hydrolase